jgi:hypothetical protein
MTREEFEQAYAQRSGVTVEYLHQHGRYAAPCRCGGTGCDGWALGHPWEEAIIEDRQRSAR